LYFIWTLNASFLLFWFYTHIFSFQFLQSYELETSFTAFSEECTSMGFEVPAAPKKDRIKQEHVIKILQYFADKDLKNFFDVSNN
jgi:hypothetical protein